MSDECGYMEESTEKVDSSSLDAASTVKTEPADDVYSLEEETIVKEELEVGPTVIRPPDLVSTPQPCKQEPVEDTPAGTSYSVERPDNCTRDHSYSTISEQVNTRTTSIDNGQSNRCDTCNKHFKFISYLKRHSRIHTGEQPFNCEECNKCFKASSHLKEHSRSHTGEYCCEICNKCFNTSSHLEEHSRIHTGERPFNCEICQKCFKSSSHLKEHSTIHIGERQFSCEICNKCFKLGSNLTTHMKSHISERPFNCEVCNKSFKYRNSIMEHMKTHTGEREYNCEICNKCFKSSSHLKEHSRIHTGERPFNCEICNMCFTPRGSLISSEIRLRRDSIHKPTIFARTLRRRCAVCAIRKKYRKAQTGCLTCDKGLCFETCWEDYHSMVDLK